jgi:undecaprenyl diphosphate synthase
MKLLKRFLSSEIDEMMENGIRLNAIGRTHKLPKDVHTLLLEAIDRTSNNRDMVLTIALSYGGRQEILDGVRHLAEQVRKGDLSVEDITEKRLSEALYTADMPDPDLLIRTSGEFRVSNFLLWQVAYAEFYFTPTLWPDFREQEYLAAIEAYQGRERRFGATGEQLSEFEKKGAL